MCVKILLKRFLFSSIAKYSSVLVRLKFSIMAIWSKGNINFEVAFTDSTAGRCLGIVYRKK